MKIAILTSGIMPVPAVQGGAVENLIDFYLEYNEQQHLHDINVISVWHPNVRNLSEKKSNVNHYQYVKQNGLLAKINKYLYQKRHQNEYYHYTIEYYFEQAIKKKIHIYDKSLNADKLYAIIMKKLEEFGTFKETESRKTYVPNNPDLLYQVVIDHIGLMKPSNGRNKKGEIDTTVAYLITLRNMAQISPTIIQQINREQSNIERFKAGRTGIQLSDLKETADTSDAAEVVAALYGPNRDKLNTYRGYDVKRLGDHIRMIQILKTRFGEADVEIAVNFHGGVNVWAELPLPNEIYDYSKYTTPDYLINKEDKDEKVEEDKSQNNNFKLII